MSLTPKNTASGQPIGPSDTFSDVLALMEKPEVKTSILNAKVQSPGETTAEQDAKLKEAIVAYTKTLVGTADNEATALVYAMFIQSCVSHGTSINTNFDQNAFIEFRYKEKPYVFSRKEFHLELEKVSPNMTENIFRRFARKRSATILSAIDKGVLSPPNKLGGKHGVTEGYTAMACDFYSFAPGTVSHEKRYANALARQEALSSSSNAATKIYNISQLKK